MAVLPGVPGISVQIKIAGDIATEYHDPEEHSASESDGLPSSHCYIESRAGLEFAIETTVTRGYDLKHGHDHLTIWPRIDGQLRTGQNLDLKPDRVFTKTAVLSTAYTASDTPNMVNNANFVFIPITTSRLTSIYLVEWP